MTDRRKLIIILGFLLSFGIYYFFRGSGDASAPAAPGKRVGVSTEGNIGTGTLGTGTVQAYVLPLAETSYIPILNTGLRPPSIQAKSAFVYDLRSGRTLFAQSSKTRLPIASITKIMTAVAVKENLNFRDLVSVPASAVKVDGEKQALYADEQISVDNLVKLMLVESSNDAAYALEVYASGSKDLNLVAEMNKKAAALGMADTYFKDSAGLNDDGYSTAEDIARAARYSLRYSSIWSVLKEKRVTVASADGKIQHQANNTDQLLGVINNIVGGKTGYTDGALGCMLLVIDIPKYDDKIISVVLGSHDRFSESKKLVNWVIAAYRWE